MSGGITLNVGNKILYEPIDDRINLHELDERLAHQDNDLKEAAKEQSKSIACMIRVSNFIIDQVTQVHRLNTRSLASKMRLTFGYPLAQDEKFGDELAPGFGTAFLVSKNTVYTAAHNVCKDGVDGVIDAEMVAATRLIFNFKTNADGSLRTTYNKAEIYRIKKVKAHRFVASEIDWAWVRLDRDVVGVKPLDLDFSLVEKKTPIYMLGHPKGLPLKLAPTAQVKKAKKEYEYITADLDAFSGNSGSPIFDRVTKKVVALLFFGNHPDYGIHKDYEGLGQHRVKALRATEQQIATNGYERCQLVSQICVHLDQRIIWIAKIGMRQCEEKSNCDSKQFVEKTYQKIRDRKKNLCISTTVAFIPTPWTVIGGIIISRDLAKGIRKCRNKLSLAKEIKSRFKYEINLLEAHRINKFGLENFPEIDQLRIARYSIAFFELSHHKFFSSICMAKRMVEIEKNFGDRFSPETVVSLAVYEIEMGIEFMKYTRELILTYMHNDYGNPEHSVVNARIKACYKITKNEPAYRNWNKQVIKDISSHMVKSGNRLNFEEAREELGCPKP